MRAAMYLRQSKDRDGDELAVTASARTAWAVRAAGLDDHRVPGQRPSASNGKPRPDYQRCWPTSEQARSTRSRCGTPTGCTASPVELEDFIDLADTKMLSLATIGGDFDLSTPTGRGTPG